MDIRAAAEATAQSGLPLGSLTARGELGALMISDSMLIRQRNNPFYAFMADHVVTWLAATTRAH